MRKAFVFVLLLILPIGISGISYGETIFEGTCAQGGSMIVDSSDFSYNPANGAFSIIFRFNDCIDDMGIKFDGTISSSGTFQSITETTANVVVNTVINATGTVEGNTINISDCRGRYEGIYDISTERLNGSMNLNCSVSGGINIDLIKLLTGPKPEI